jgi:hypothetical protein
MTPIVLHPRMVQNEAIGEDQSLQSNAVGHKRGHIIILTEKITHNNSIRTQNMNQLLHTTAISVL